jgi:hypothetical protein
MIESGADAPYENGRPKLFQHLMDLGVPDVVLPAIEGYNEVKR